MYQFKINFILIISLFSCSTYAQSTANYDFSFTSTWSNTTHPYANFPSNAHWSNLVGATHNGTITFVESGTLASSGIEDVAETGSNTEFYNEVNDVITAGNADQWLQQSFSPYGAIGTATLFNIIVSENYPLLSLISMIAPSPDWMIYVNSLNLRNAVNDGWKDTFTIDLFPYDAGTEDNTIVYSTNNNPTNPPQVISSLQNVVPFSNLKVGTLTVTLNEVLGVNEVNSINKILLFPNPSKDILIIRNTINIELKTVKIYNILGSLVFQLNIKDLMLNDDIQIDLSDLNSGIYLIKLSDINNRNKTQKLIIE